MRITFDNQSLNKFQNASKAYNTDSSVNVKGIGSSYEITESLDNSKTYEGKRMSVSEFRESLKAKDVETTQDYMTFMAHSMSKEDFAKVMKSGEMPASIEPEEMVTIMDYIKLNVAKSGKNIEGFTDTLDKETYEEMGEAMAEASDVDEMTDAMKDYLVSNDKDLTIHNLYVAKHSAYEKPSTQGGEFFEVEAKGYLVKKGSDTDVTETEESVKGLLSKIGLPVNEETVEEGMWLVEHSLCVNEDNMKKLSDIDSIAFPLDKELLTKAICVAVNEGKECKDADLTKTESVYDKAVRMTAELESLIEKPFVKATRVLEETRLKMTAEANLILLKSGVSIDTKDIEAYVEALKKIEESTEYKEAKAIVDVEETVETVKEAPVAVIAPVSDRINEINLSEVALEGDRLKQKYEIAGIAYEQVSTTVRKDYGDSIKKAFRNIPEILEDLGVEDTEDNRRAVRILGYNSMSINEDSIKKIKEADLKVRSIISRLTPKDTLSLIRQGKNPVKMSIAELNEYLETKENTEEKDIEKYSRFLYKLECNKEISERERRDFIEVYRFFHGFEKADDAAIGSVLGMGAELSFANLKVAMKSVKHKGMDVTIGEVYESLESTDDEYEEQWINEKFTEMKEALKAPEETVNELVMNKLPATVENLEAALLLRKRRGEAFRKASEASDRRAYKRAVGFSDELTEKPEAVEAYMKMTDACKASVYEEAMKSETYMDVRALQLVHRQLTVATRYAENENYEVPMEIGGQVTSVNVKLVHNPSEAPNVVVSFENEELGRVSARLSEETGKISGYIACNLKESVTKLQKAADIISDKISVVYSQGSDSDLKLSMIPMKDNTDDISSKDLYDIAKRFLGALKG